MDVLTTHKMNAGVTSYGVRCCDDPCLFLFSKDKGVDALQTHAGAVLKSWIFEALMSHTRYFFGHDFRRGDLALPINNVPKCRVMIFLHFMQGISHLIAAAI